MANLISRILTLPWLLFAALATAQQDGARWSKMIAEAVPSIVSLQISYTRDFVEVDQGVSSATGFIVDAERGIILTNRHVVGSGPVAISATFQNLERIDVVPLYRDPVHDFGFLRYKPSDLQRNQPQSLQLNPKGARVGADIRVIGSDGGEQLSILAGTIARLDRRAPNYGRYGHNDFNTFYMQAASSTSGGSSGSPVLDDGGNVIALNAAANSNTASSFFLPLDRIQYALENLQAGLPVARGTVQTVFDHRPYRFLKRLGLTAQAARRTQSLFPQSNGMLIVRQVLPGGVGVGQLQEGDVVLEVNAEPLADFVTLAAVLDASIGSEVSFSILRQGQPLTISVPVIDLNAMQPDDFIELGDSVLHDLSLQRARSMNLHQRGVVVAKAGYEFSRAGIPGNALLLELNGQTLDSLDDLREILVSASSGDRWNLRYKVPGREYTSALGRVDINDRWFAARSCERRDDTAFWSCQLLALGQDQADNGDSAGTPVVPAYSDPSIKALAPALVRLSYDIPFAVENVYAKSFKGVGLVVDAERGLIVTDRNTVPVGLGDLEITFFSTFKAPGEVVFLHPTHNIAILKYDPVLLGDRTIEAPPLANTFPDIDTAMQLVGYRNDGTIRKQNISNVSEVTLYFNQPRLPRFQQVPVDVLSASLAGPTLGGPLVDSAGKVQAIWQSFAYQDGDKVKEAEWMMPASIVADTVKRYIAGHNHYIAPAVFEYKSLEKASERGLSRQWMQRIAGQTGHYQRALAVRVVAGAESAFRVGDIVLEIDGQLPADLQHVDSLFQTPRSQVMVLRDGTEQMLDVESLVASGTGVDRALKWAGSLLHDPHFEVAFQRANATPGVFISASDTGSPSIQDRLYRNRFVVGVEGSEVRSLDDFIEQVQALPGDEPVRLTVLSMNGFRSVVSVKPESNFWPTVLFEKSDGEWQRTTLSGESSASVD